MSDIRIDLEGTWFYRGTEMSRRNIVRYFYQHLVQNDSGCFIRIGEQRCPVAVEDTAYVIRAVYWPDPGSKAESVRLLLSDDCIEDLDPETLRIGRENILYSKVKARHFDARFTTSSYYAFARNIQCDPRSNGYFIELRGRRYYIS